MSQAAIFERKITIGTVMPMEWRDRLNQLAKSYTDSKTMIELFSRGLLRFINDAPYKRRNYEWISTKAVRLIDPDTKEWTRTGWHQVAIQVSNVGDVQPEQLLGALEEICKEHVTPNRQKPNLQRGTLAVCRYILEILYPIDEYPNVVKPAKYRQKKETLSIEYENIKTSRKVSERNDTKRVDWWVGFKANEAQRTFLNNIEGGGSAWLKAQVERAMAREEEKAEKLKV